MRSAARDETGAGTLLATALTGVLVTVTVAAAAVVGLVGGHRRAQAAADLAALAGASALQQGGDACHRADEIARRNGTDLRECRVADWQVAVVVAGQVPVPGHPLIVRARARAGPVGDLRG